MNSTFSNKRPTHKPCSTPLQKIPFINAKQPFNGCQQSAHKYCSLVGLGLEFGLVLVLLCQLGVVLRLGSVQFEWLKVKQSKQCIAVQHQLSSSPLQEKNMQYGITQCYLPPTDYIVKYSRFTTFNPNCRRKCCHRSPTKSGPTYMAADLRYFLTTINKALWDLF